jgi:hypothetical protein
MRLSKEGDRIQLNKASLSTGLRLREGRLREFRRGDYKYKDCQEEEEANSGRSQCTEGLEQGTGFQLICPAEQNVTWGL